jgi:hypothetical protein
MTDQPPSTAVAVVDTSPRTGGEIAPIVPKSLDEMFFVAQTMHASGLAPKTLDSNEKVMVAIMAGMELGMAPFQGVQSFYVVNGRPVLWGDAIPAILLRNGFKMREWFEGEADDYPDVMAAWCEIARPDGAVVKRSFSVADAKKANLWTKQGPWKEYPRRMLQMRARAFAARDNAADALKGFQVREEVEDYDLRDVTPGKSGLRARLEANQGERAEGFTVENVLDEIHPVQQEKPRRTRRTKAQIALDGRVAEFLEAQPEDEVAPAAANIADQLQAPLAEVIESLQRLGVEVIESEAHEATQQAERPEGTAEPAEAAAGAPVEPETAVQAGGGAPNNGEASGDGTAGDGGAGGAPAGPLPEGVTQGPDGPLGPTIMEQGEGYAEAPTVEIVGEEEAEVDEGESQPTSAASPGPVELYRMALANAGDFPTVRGIVTEFRKTEAFQQADAAARVDINRSAVERLNRMREGGMVVPGVGESVWLFALWMPLADNDSLKRAFDTLQASGDWQATPQDRQAIIASAVRERVGGLL